MFNLEHLLTQTSPILSLVLEMIQNPLDFRFTIMNIWYLTLRDNGHTISCTYLEWKLGKFWHTHTHTSPWNHDHIKMWNISTTPKVSLMPGGISRSQLNTDLLITVDCLHFLKSYINKIIPYILSFMASFIQHNYLWLIHVMVCISSSFLTAECLLLCRCIQRFFNPFTHWLK